MIEKISIPNARNEMLAGVLNDGMARSPLIVLVHGFAGNKDENGLFVEAEKYFHSRNFNTFRYDAAGVGESEGDYVLTTLERQASDLESVITGLRSRYPHNKISVVGFSLGATVSTLINPKIVDQYVFWSPALFTAKDMFPRYSTEDVLAEINSKGYLDKNGTKIGTPIINDFKKYSPESPISKIKNPVLLIHGTQNIPRIDYRSTIAAQKLFSNAQFISIPGANHSYKNNSSHRITLFSETYEWLVKQNSSC